MVYPSVYLLSILAPLTLSQFSSSFTQLAIIRKISPGVLSCHCWLLMGQALVFCKRKDKAINEPCYMCNIQVVDNYFLPLVRFRIETISYYHIIMYILKIVIETLSFKIFQYLIYCQCCNEFLSSLVLTFLPRDFFFFFINSFQWAASCGNIVIILKLLRRQHFWHRPRNEGGFTKCNKKYGVRSCCRTGCLMLDLWVLPLCSSY